MTWRVTGCGGPPICADGRLRSKDKKSSPLTKLALPLVCNRTAARRYRTSSIHGATAALAQFCKGRIECCNSAHRLQRREAESRIVESKSETAL